jgi:hypothetical protein
LTWFEKNTDVTANAISTAVSVSKYSNAVWPEAENLKRLVSGTLKGYIPGKYVFNEKVKNLAELH